jgi:hypothetical protein
MHPNSVIWNDIQHADVNVKAHTGGVSPLKTIVNGAEMREYSGCQWA